MVCWSHCATYKNTHTRRRRRRRRRRRLGSEIRYVRSQKEKKRAHT